MTKRLSQIQWQGITGEKAFELWTVRNRVLPTKLDPDQGIDYVCQVVGDKTERASFQTPGHLMAVAVRSSDKAEVKVQLDRNDAELLLRVNIPVALAILDLRSDGEFPEVHFRFLDKPFIRELLAFLRGRKRSRTVKANTCVSDPEAIRSAIRRAFLPGEWEKLNAVKRELRLQDVVPDARLRVVSTGTSTYSLVKTPSFFDQYDTRKPEVQATIDAAVFGRQEFFAPRLQSLPLRDGFLAALEDMPSPILVGGVASEEHCPVQVSATRAEAIASCNFALRRHDIWMAYCHTSGITLKISKAVERGGQQVHLTEDFVDPETRVRDLLAGEIGAFLECARDEADLSFHGRMTLPARHFPNLGPLGWLGVYLRQLGDQEWLDLAEWRANTVTEEDLQSLRFLACLKETPGMLNGFGFLTGGFAAEDAQGRERRFLVPLCMNVHGTGLVCWLDTAGIIFLEPEGLRCVGLRLGSATGVKLRGVDRTFPTGGLPKMKVFSGWPAIALHQTEQEFMWAGNEDWGVELQFMEE